ncbi:hypothetical protein [Gemmata sp.]|uniref:hypothetical protein n=1 Tax=Gemmata sp. TaxID=1914242 RepID=UPI003F730181
MANFPPGLEAQNILAPATALAAKDLFMRLPRTVTIGEMVRLYYPFSFSKTYEPFTPTTGATDLLFSPGDADFPPNRARVEYRRASPT